MDPYLDLGEERGVRALVDRFYDAMETQPFATGLRAMHAADLEPMRDRLTAFLCGWLGGPPRYEERFGHVCMRGAHAPYAIDPALADAWVECMRLALLDAALDAPLDRALLQAFTRTAHMLVNRPDPSARAPRHTDGTAASAGSDAAPDTDVAHDADGSAAPS